MTQTLLLIRHGQASAGSANYDRLSERGREQSRHLGDWWKARKFAPDASFHGTLERQRDTAAISLSTAGLDTHCSIIPALDEYNHRAVDAHLGHGADVAEGGAAPVNPETMTYEQYASIMHRWRDSESLPDALESWAQFATRGWADISEAARAHPANATLAFFTSGGIIATVVAAALDLDFDHCIDAIWRLRNASITTLAFDGDKARLFEFNNVTHLDLHQDPELITSI